MDLKDPYLQQKSWKNFIIGGILITFWGIVCLLINLLAIDDSTKTVLKMAVFGFLFIAYPYIRKKWKKESNR